MNIDERMNSIHVGTFHPRTRRSVVHNPALAGSLSLPSSPVSCRALFQVCLPRLRSSSRNFALRRLQAIPKRFCLFTTRPPKRRSEKNKKRNINKGKKKKNRKKERRRRRRPGISSGSGRRRIRRRAAAGGEALRCCFGYSLLFTIRQKTRRRSSQQQWKNKTERQTKR